MYKSWSVLIKGIGHNLCSLNLIGVEILFVAKSLKPRRFPKPTGFLPNVNKKIAADSRTEIANNQYADFQINRSKQ